MYRKKNLLALAFALLLPMGFANAAVVSFQVVQHDESQGEVRLSSRVVEDALLGYFFDAGHIVSNSPLAVSGTSSADERLEKTSLDQAREGMCDVLVLVYTEYVQTPGDDIERASLSAIKGISWKIYDVKTGKLLKDGEQPTGNINKKDDTEKGIVRFAQSVATKINESLSKRK